MSSAFACAAAGGTRHFVARRGNWRRLGRRRFRYVDASGAEIRDAEQLARVRSLVIPPAWEDVWISPNPRAHVQATGIDAAERKQYRYHPRYRAAQEQAKFDRLFHFAKALPVIRTRGARDLGRKSYERDWACALAVGLINKAWFRAGSDRHAKRARTYGITTLTQRHVSVVDSEVRFIFRGKNSKLVRRSVRSEPLARGVSELLELPGGGRLFRYEREGDLMPLTAPHLNGYIAEHMGNGFTAKDFRTWGGTLVAASQLARRGPAESERDAKRTLVSVMRAVGDELGNTPAVARNSYVSPVVVDAYLAGRTLEDFRTATARPRQLSADERALVRMLRAASR